MECTRDSGREHAVRAIGLGAYDFLTKPRISLGTLSSCYSESDLDDTYMDEPKQTGLPSLRFLEIFALIEPFERFTGEVKRITALQSLDFPERMEMIREASEALVRELEGCFETFAEQLKERKIELQNFLKSPKPDLNEQIQRLLMEMSELVKKLALREELTRRWEAESPEEILRAYENSLIAGETDTLEMFETYAEDILERKGNKASLAAFRERRERERDLRLTSEQLRAKQELQQLERLGTFLHAIYSDIALSVKRLISSETDPPLPSPT